MQLPLYFTKQVNSDISKVIKLAFDKKKEDVVIVPTGMSIFSMLNNLNGMRPDKKLTIDEYRDLRDATKAVSTLIKRYRK
jgi:hypothetical protein